MRGLRERSGVSVRSQLARRLSAVAAAALVAHVALRLWLAAEGSSFATEDDGYRAYYGYLAAEGTASFISLFWLPGQFFALGALGRLGLDAATAPLVLGALSVALTLAAVRSLARDLAPPGWGEAAGLGAVAMAAVSPLLLRLGHSALAEPLANGLSAYAAAALVRGQVTGTRRLVGTGALVMLCATWVRYETWPYAAVYVLAAYLLARRRAGHRAALGDAGLASLALLGPLGWLLAQQVVHGDPLAFLATVNEMSETLAGPASRMRVAALRGEALALWSGGAVAGVVVALVRWRDQPRLVWPLALLAALGLPGLALQVASGKGLGVFVVAGREFEFFVPRLVSSLEVGLFPLAGLGLAGLVASRTSRARVGLVALAALAAALLAHGVTRPMSFVDPSSVRAGVMLRRGELDREIGSGALLVERVEPRPPMGWASVSVLWSRWERTVFLTRRGRVCELVEPSDVLEGRARIPCADLRAWMDARGVSAAWVLGAPAREAVETAWPSAGRRTIGDGVLYSAPSAP